MFYYSTLRATPRWACILIGTTVASLAANEGSLPGPSPLQLAPVIVPGRNTDLIGVATSAAQGIVGAAEFAARPFLRRGELLEVIPGVAVTQHSGSGKANQYFLRGFNLDHGTDFSLSVDGMPVNLRSHAHGQGYADLNFIIPEMIQQVDYNKGPFYTDVGDFSAAGAAQFRHFNHVDRPFLSLTWGETHFVRLVAGGSLAHTSGSLTGAVEISMEDGPWQLAENAKRFNGFARRHWTSANADYRITAMAYRGQWRASDQIPLRAVEAGDLDRFGHVDPTAGGESERASVSVDATLKDAAMTRFNGYVIFYRLNLFSNFTYFLDDPVNGDQFNQRDRRWILGGSAQRTWTHAAGARRSATSFGLQGQADFIDEVGLHRTRQRERLSSVRDDRVDEGSVAFFADNETQWTDWLRSKGGLRFDGFRFKVRSDDSRNSGLRLADTISPKLTLAFGPWQKTELYANAGFGFHSNDARGTSIRFDPVQGTPVAAVTPLARSRGAEIGVRTSPRPGSVTTLSVWGLDLDSELVFVGDAGGTEPSGRTRRYGLELANYVRLNAWCAVDADVAFTHARYRDHSSGESRVANSLSSVVTAGVALGRATGWFGSARLRYYGPQPLTEDNAVRAPSSLTYALGAGWRARDWQVAIDVFNVFDRRNYDIAYYYASRLPGEPEGGREDLHFHPAEPRTVRLTMTRRF